MATNKRITDLTDYTSVLPYASEIFGVYQPMIGWKSKRLTKRLNQGLVNSQGSALKAYTKNYIGAADTNFVHSQDCIATITNIEIGKQPAPALLKNYQSVLVANLAKNFPDGRLPDEQEWMNLINEDMIRQCLNSSVLEYYTTYYKTECTFIKSRADNPLYAGHDLKKDSVELINSVKRLIAEESAMAGAMLDFAGKKQFPMLENIFYQVPDNNLEVRNQLLVDIITNNDPFATFNPKNDIKNVSLSPLGIVHLFRQYFFELDTFLGTPTGHVWLSPGSTVELIEVSTRRIYTEKIIEQSTEFTQKNDRSSSDKEEISLAVKEDNKTDLKLGATLTVNQSWGTGNATATSSLNMDKTQSTAREVTSKRMREQTEKFSSEIRQNFKSTFKTITETTDTSSKRYVLTNTTPDLINYELRRKMRQVGVQVQDIGTYLCWETFVDEPGNHLGLADLVHVAKPADLVAVPDTTKIPYPEDKPMEFTVSLSYNLGDNPARNGPDGFQPLETRSFGKELPDIPEGYKVSPGSIFVKQLSATGTDFEYFEFDWRSIAIGKDITFGVHIADGGYNWDNEIRFVIGVKLQLTATSDKRKEIDAANAAKLAANITATEENKRKTKEEFFKAAKERIEFASNIKTRKYEDLREEERIIVYRELIGALMSEKFYGALESDENDQIRHTLSELINSIFDVDKMLYFVAPEWWKPRKHHNSFAFTKPGVAFGRIKPMDLGGTTVSNDLVVNWSDFEDRPDNYYITEKSEYAKMGSSLGWLLQLDGDDLRNAFLNAPWVKAVIPIRPGKELEATNWLQQMQIEGTEGLGNLYQGQEEELDKIRAALSIADVTIADALKYLCAEVAAKHQESLKVGRYPKEEINDDNKVNATPIDKVYEHGFYPLKGGFKAVAGDNESYDVFDQWIEVLPTDQVVPVEVKYDPKTGRQV